MLIAFTGLVYACNEPANKQQSNSQSAATTNPEVQKVIDELGLVYVEEGAQTIITYDEVHAAEKAWCDGLIQIGKIKEEGGDYKAFTEKMLDEQYNFKAGKVFFKPTLAFGNQTFRTDKKGTLSYFVGGDSDYPNDKGFALKPWVAVKYDNLGESNEGIQIYGSVAITMGNVTFTAKDGSEVTVEKLWVFKKDKDGKLRIIVHKSALPFNPEA